MPINLGVPEKTKKLSPRVLVLGVGGGGCNALNTMIASKLKGVEFVACNTDAQSLEHCNANQKIQLGESQTQGLGAGSDPAIGKAAAEESYNEICEYIDGAHMAFITAGMGGGTGTGAVPVIAKACREKGLLTVAVVTKPFDFEGTLRMQNAEKGVSELRQYVDTLIVIPNQNLFIVSDDKTSYAEALSMADQVLYSGVRGITDLMMLPGLINLDFADVKSVMSEMGRAVLGNGEAAGERRAVEAAESAIANPLLDHVSMQGAKGLLLNISGGSDMTLVEVHEAAERIKQEVHPDAKIIYGTSINKELDGLMRVSIVATGIENIVNLEKEKSDRKQETDIFEKSNKVNLDAPEVPQQTDLEDFTDPTSVEIERNDKLVNTNKENLNSINNEMHEKQEQPSNIVMEFIKKFSPLKIFKSKKEDEIEKEIKLKNAEQNSLNDIENLNIPDQNFEQKETIKDEKTDKIEIKEEKNEEKLEANEEVVKEKKEPSIQKPLEPNIQKAVESSSEKIHNENKEKKELQIQAEMSLDGGENNIEKKEDTNTNKKSKEEDLEIPSFLRNQSN